MSHYRIVNERTSEVVTSQARMADTAKLRMVGLLGKKGLPPGDGLLIRPCWSIHTMFMRFALDVIFVNREGEVLKVVRKMPPYRFAAARGAHDAIEMNAGALDGSDIQRGDRLSYIPLEAPVEAPR